MRINPLAATLVLTSCILPNVNAQRTQWKPVDGPLLTRWAADVSPETALHEHPRPQLVRDDWANLNGLWQYAIRPSNETRPASWDGQILVPFCIESALSGVGRRVDPDQALWYRRSFDQVPPANGRLLLHFGAVDWHATIWVNDQRVGEHQGGYDPFTIDITDALRDAPQELVVRVTDPTDAGWQPRGKQVKEPGGIWYTSVTGIWRTVWLERVPNAHITSLRITPDVDASSVSIAAHTTTLGKITATVTTEGRVVGVATGRNDRPLTINLDDPNLWSPDDPFLYDLNVTLETPGSSDSVSSYFGMRKIERRKDREGVNRLFLNNKPLFHFGLLDQGWWPDGLYTAPTDAALRYDVEISKRLGFNTARKHVKIEPDRWYYWCDHLGLLVWQDMPSGDKYIHGDMPDITRSSESAAGFERELKAMVDTLYNHPSIVMWVPFNEGWGQWDTPRICELIKSWDATRLVNNTSGWTDRNVADVLDIHRYPGPASAPLETDRAVVLGEFGGLGLPVPGHTWQDEKNWGYRSYETREALTDAYVELLRQLRPLIGQGLAAGIYTQTSDVEIEVNGVMTYDRAEIKLDEVRATDAARKLFLPAPIVTDIVTSSQSQPQQWKYTTNPPPADWTSPGFNDASWSAGQGGFGESDTPGAHVRTQWKSSDIWIRRTFDLDSVQDHLFLLIHHDEDAEVYLNGVPAATPRGYVTGYTIIPIAQDAQIALRKGENCIAIHCHQTAGGQYIDAGIVRVVEQDTR